MKYFVIGVFLFLCFEAGFHASDKTMRAEIINLQLDRDELRLKTEQLRVALSIQKERIDKCDAKTAFVDVISGDMVK